MKRRYLFFLTALLLLVLCLLVGCAEDNTEPMTLSCRVIAVMDRELLLAADGHPPIMALSPAANPKISVLRDGAAAPDGDAPIPGDWVLLTFSDGITETSPALPRGVTQMDIISDGFDNLAAVYLQVLTDLAAEQASLIADKSMLAVSLEATALPAWERTAVVAALAQYITGQYPAMTVIEESRSDLIAKGFLTKDPDSPRWHWQDGSILSVSEITHKCTDRKRYFIAFFDLSHAWTGCHTARDTETGIWLPYEKGGSMLID
ncbi:MAG: hypothetical protein IJW77_11570 [Clostridia bacterium]|nr:hypothetical protein [Clostridia bacterium]